MKEAITVWNCTCEKCGSNWTSRSEKVPKMCPSCKSVNWDKSSEKPITFPKPQEGQTGWEVVGVGKFNLEGERLKDEVAEVQAKEFEPPIKELTVELD